ncbi:hypothetical protein AAHA92_07362 [Salvia divinorum]|uniref:Uncharacterized protein n=1 Tax=Salvia divinorum TaxID=28513 RepID=A0ABD1I8T6_SALDI
MSKSWNWCFTLVGEYNNTGIITGDEISNLNECNVASTREDLKNGVDRVFGSNLCASTSNYTNTSFAEPKDNLFLVEGVLFFGMKRD